MDENINLGDDIGYVSMTIDGITQRLDVWECYARLMDFYAQHATSYEGYLTAVAEFLSKKGYGELSLRAADKFAEAIFARVVALKKSEEASNSADSPASTEQESSIISESQVCS